MHRLHYVLQFFETSLKNASLKIEIHCSKHCIVKQKVRCFKWCLRFEVKNIHLFKNWNKSVVKQYHTGLFCGETYGYGICGRLGFRIQLIVPTQFERKIYPDMEFVQNFTPPDFQAKNFTPSISPNFNSFSKKKHKKWVKMEKFTPLAKILHCRRHWRHGQIPPLDRCDWKGVTEQSQKKTQDSCS